MAERAHPELSGFRNHFQFRWRKKVIPWISLKQSPYRKAFLNRYKWVSQYTRNKTVLDIPCGMGWGTSLIRNAKKIVGVDISELAIDEAKRRYGHKVDFFVGDMGKLDFEKNSFEVLICLEGIEHVSEEIGISFINEAARVLTSEGMLLLSSPYCLTGKHSGNPYHIKEYKPSELRGLLGSHFDIKDVHEKRVDGLVVSYVNAKKR